ncbi:MAG: metallophosphoesterase [Negativicutes bacterium]|nr:metallophosphoesterase [Negativicutes bacterium]
MRSLLVGLIILTITLLASWINHRLLAKWFSIYRRGPIRYGYLFATIAVCLIIGYSWSLRITAFALPFEELRYLSYAAFAWIIGQIVLLLFLPLLFLLQYLMKPTVPAAPSADDPATLSRRRFLQGALAAAPVMALGIGASGVLSATGTPVVRRFSLAFPSAPGLSGFKIAQISDTHVGAYVSVEQFSRIVALVEKEQPDLVVLTGDFVDDLGLLTPSVKILSALAPAIPHGVYFCWGNHEYFRDIGRIRSELRNSPITILENSSTPIMAGQQPLHLLGVDYPWTNTPEARRRLLALARKNVPPDAFTVLLAHHPDFLFESFAAGIPLTLSGHSHGGQVVVFGKTLLPFPYVYMRGLYQGNQVYGYVNSGAGHWFPYRFGCPPEISIFTLNSASA